MKAVMTTPTPTGQQGLDDKPPSVTSTSRRVASPHVVVVDYNDNDDDADDDGDIVKIQNERQQMSYLDMF